MALAGGGDLDTVGLRLTARVRLVLELHVEERQGRVESLDLGELGVDALGKVLRHLNVAARDGDLGLRAQDSGVLSR